ncbi:hypothetical protein C5615_38025 [Burkholderia cepacia]|uniref:Dermonecrotic toxin N-terminal domain-containing protein n=2 Tax=Burkholderia cepacia TaxID=292 RepID=A0A2S8HXH5_BURCE|nr:hypothetical protein C5615_38025 [Burkholderia cepacia]
MYVITERSAAGNVLDSKSDVGTALLVAPGQPIKKFESMQALAAEFGSQLDDPAQRGPLLQHVEARQRTAMSNGDVTLRYGAIRGDVFKDRLNSQIKQQQKNLDYLEAQQDWGSISQTDAQKRGQEIADGIRSRSNMAPYLAERQDQKQDEKNLALLKEQLPDWLKTRPVANNEASSYHSTEFQTNWERERETYLGLAKVAVDKQLEASGATADIQTLDEYTETKAKAYLSQHGFPDVDPDKVSVSVERTTKTVDATAWQSPAGTDVRVDRQIMSLSAYLQRNNDPSFTGSYSSVAVSASLQDETPLDLDVKEMAKALNIGQKYQDYLKDEFISSAGAARREKLQQADRAVFEKDISQAKLQGAIGETQDERGTKWAEAILNQPDANSRPTVDGYTIEASRLSIKGEQVANVYVIGPKEKDSMQSVLLYTPDAPHGKSLREFRDRSQLAQALKTDALRDYLIQRVDPGAQGAVRSALTSSGGSSFTEDPIKGNFFDAMYQDRVNRTIVNADRATTSNAEVGKQTAWNLYNWGMDAMATIPGIGLPIDLGQAGVSLYSSAETAQSGDTNAAKEYLFDAVTRAIMVDPSGALLPRKHKGNVPSIKQQPGANGESTYRVAMDNTRRIPSSFAMTRPGDLGEPERGVYSAMRNGQKHEYVQIDGQFYGSGQNGQGRYIQHPSSPANRIQLERVGDKWQLREPPSRGLLGGGKDKSATDLPSILSQIQAAGITNREVLQRLRPGLASYLSADANQETFNRLVDLATAEGRLSLDDRAAALAESTPYSRASRFLERFDGANDSAGISRFPDLLSEARRNGERAQAASASINNRVAQERRTLAEWPARIASGGQLDSDARRRQIHELSNTLASYSNSDVFDRLIDIQVANGRLGASDAFQLREDRGFYQTPYERAHALLTNSSSRTRPENWHTGFSDDLQQAIIRTPGAAPDGSPLATRAAQDRQHLDRLPQRLQSEGITNGAAFGRLSPELAAYLSTPANQEIFTRLVDLATAEGRLTLDARAAALAESTPYNRASRFLDEFRARNLDAELSRFPDLLDEAKLNGKRARSAPAKLNEISRNEQQALSTWHAENGSLTSNTFGRNQHHQLAQILSRGGNHATLDRLIDLAAAEGRVSLNDRAAAFAESNRYNRAFRFLELLASRHTDAGSSIFPDLLSAAINNGARAQSAPASINNRVAQERRALAEWPARIASDGRLDSDALRRQVHELSQTLASYSNSDVFDRLIDIQRANGRLGADDVVQIRRRRNRHEPPYNLARALLTASIGRSSADNWHTDFSRNLQRAIDYARRST